LVVAILAFLGDSVRKGQPGQLLIIALFMISFILLARRYRNIHAESAPTTPPSLKPLGLGIAIFILSFLILPALASHHVNPLLYYATLVGGLWLYKWLLARKNPLNSRDLLLFGLGVYIQNALFASLLYCVMLQALALPVVATEIVLIAWFIRL